MSEIVKTSLFAAAALVVALLAFASVYLAQPVGIPPHEEIGKDLFPEFKDPLKAASLEIVRAPESSVNLQRFEVEQGADGRWVIPSHGGYPADAENRIRDAATALIDLKIMDVATESAGDHEFYGVIEPTAENAGKEGVGTRIVMKDKDDKDLVRLIVGPKVKDHETHRFVRRGNQDRVYVAPVNLDAFPAKFEEWIDPDLLKLDPFNVKKLTIRDYSLPEAFNERTGQLVRALNLRMDLAVSEENNNWTLDSFTLYRNNQPDATALLPEEELNEQKLDDLKNGLDELKIVDVRRKPQGLGADLRANPELLQDEEGWRSLEEIGIFRDPRATDKTELFAANGEVIVTLKDGVEYLLKFGDTAGGEDAAEGGKLNRYLLVTARLNEAMIPKPELQELPPLPEDSKSAEGSASNAAPAEGDAEAQDDAAASETNSKDDDAGSEEGSEEKPVEKKSDDRAKIEAERERIAKENQRKQDEYSEKLEAAKKQVRDLNARFADWYYVVSEDTFKKVRLTRADVIKEKESVEEEGFGVDAFRSLEEEGLKKQEPAKKLEE